MTATLEQLEELLDLALVTIAAAVIYAGDGIEAALIARGVAEEGEPWARGEPDGATPRMSDLEAVQGATALLAHAKFTLGMIENNDEG